jgi:hypothetical protein
VHAEKELPSSWHWKETPDSASVKLKLALVDVLGLGGLAVIVGGGGALRSTVTDVVVLSAPLQLLWAGVTEYLHVPSGTDVSLHVVPGTVAEQVPDEMLWATVPVES